MKLSTKILLSLLATFVVAVIVSVVMMRNLVLSLDFSSAEHEYVMVIESNNPDNLPECKVRLVTTCNKCDSLVVNFDNVHPQVSAMLRNDSIIVVIDSAFVVAGEEEILCVTLPDNVGIELHNPYPQVDMELLDCNFAYLLYNSPSDLKMNNNNISALFCTDSSVPRHVALLSSNVDAFKLNGNGTNLSIDHSNICAAVIEGVCDAISISDSNVGACSWSSENDSKAQCVNSVVNASIDEGLIDITYDGETF